ncbi:GIY-YIG nuclease family protein [Acinetobacter haemolyticus]|uniref:GIY-YIG nuclease family protein n=1 Tax=Acinetobacter haemolyticus TaxID=29430 RepID=UPI001331C8DA|nr:GIY-YIG nuclease family protein [Acinetobacter haemolyticus]NAR17553.1 GIY-YIG nuclease family protein [Acinetobacter haemolyticus]NAR37085.1 GIY-YIG nuclease family protein [Acinetobacter haemolyticus]NAR49047.1 GIY-YIG nuclease family protein [Acinetobacter haemolyticus]QHI18546.1 GIY-YIG nuclease family protein [Acinetobacter haemolyticus]
MLNNQSSLTFKKLMSLINDNPLNETTKIKYVRHKDNREFCDLFEDALSNINDLEEYQRIQSKNVFKGLDYIISFLGTEKKKALFWGVFKVKNETYNSDNLYEYELEEMPQFNEFKFRLVVDWGDATLAWHQHYTSDKNILEIYPMGGLDKFPGYEYVNLSWKQLTQVLEKEVWRTALQNQKAVYLITDTSNGKKYVGSAYAKTMLLNRWENYAKNRHGGNIQLEQLPKEHIEENFRYSILDIFKSTTDDNIILHRESWWKNILLSRHTEFGYNSN